jgi:dihydroxy-acid dehydratase
MLQRTSRALGRRSFSTTTAQCAENPVMNRYSRVVTQPKDQGASQVPMFSNLGHFHSLTFLQAMLYATEGIKTDADFNKAMVGVASVW